MTELPIVENAQLLKTLMPVFLTRCGAAALCGAIVGIERELKRKPSGFRTNILICVGSAIYMTVGLLLTNVGGETGADPGRIAAQVVTGIGFLGAGTIIQVRDRVSGLTTAAGIWSVAAVGMTFGFGLYVLGAGAARSALPSAVRGIPGVRQSSHCALNETGSKNTARAILDMDTTP